VSARPRLICVVIDTADQRRVAEALRAAVGLGLRGDRVHVVTGPDFDGDASPAITRATGTLRALGHAVTTTGAGAAVRGADAVEVWT
jgi:hypothetical protein